jgi:hypothetical protein
MTKLRKTIPYLAAIGVLSIAAYATSKLMKAIDEMEFDLDFGNDIGLTQMFRNENDD